ncbi:MAG: penicillin-binding protein 2, partial [Kiloniellales bacterium]|nr:penicillin-binding protein 2 [Kiloniellales bacterium]
MKRDRSVSSEVLTALDIRPQPDEKLRLTGYRSRYLETGRNRLVFTGMIFFLAFSVIALRLAELALLQEGHEPALARHQSHHQLETGRADIVDRNGIVLATTLPAVSLYANPRHIRNPQDAAERLAPLLPRLTKAEIANKLSEDKSFVWLKRNISPREQYSFNRLGVPGVYFQEEQRRVYPQGDLASHVVGFAGIDNNGLAGIERSFDDALRGSATPLELSLDIRVQHALNEELSKAMETYQGIGAAGLVLDVVTGEVVAMSSLPSFDPALPGKASK